MTAHVDYAAAFSLGQPRRSRVVGAVRYALVLGVWLGLLAVRPRLAIRIFQERRPDSPIPRRR